VLLACTGAALSLGAVAGAASGQSPSFAAPRVLAASLDPDALAIGDLNGDGRLDLAIANSYFDAEEGRVVRSSATCTSANGGASFAGDRSNYVTVSPNGDGIRDPAHISFRLSRPAGVTLRVLVDGGRKRQASSEPVRRLWQRLAIRDPGRQAEVSPARPSSRGSRRCSRTPGGSSHGHEFGPRSVAAQSLPHRAGLDARGTAPVLHRSVLRAQAARLAREVRAAVEHTILARAPLTRRSCGAWAGRAVPDQAGTVEDIVVVDDHDHSGGVQTQEPRCQTQVG
jgi:FG-GAP repeat protein